LTIRGESAKLDKKPAGILGLRNFGQGEVSPGFSGIMGILLFGILYLLMVLA
jgi:hypothetical protein